MDRKPPPQLIVTFIFATVLKLVGTFVAMVTGVIIANNWLLSRWWMSLLTGTILLIILIVPWSTFFNSPHRPVEHWQLIIALAFAIISPHIDLFQSSWSLVGEINPQYHSILGWIPEQASSVHALGILFGMVAVVLACWQYGLPGFFISLTASGLLYVAMPLVLPASVFDWSLYAVRGFVTLGTTLILGFTVLTLVTAQRRKEDDLRDANKKLQSAYAQLALQASTMEQLTISRERNRLSRELHDTLAHSLSATAVQLQAIQTLMQFDPNAAKTELKAAQAQIRSGLKEARRAISALRASPLEDLGLTEGLKQRAASIAERAGIIINCNFPPLPTISLDIEQLIYRTAEEALANVERHANARQVEVRLSVDADQVILSVADDGVGFDVGMLADTGRFGLRGMEERATLHAGRLTIQSEIGSGTTILLHAPLSGKANS